MFIKENLEEKKHGEKNHNLPIYMYHKHYKIPSSVHFL